ncbi:MAG: HD domain-containing protein [Planctomycetes bacterium]|nr:HD domain-containing protein [Planctomycetota bacterium]
MPRDHDRITRALEVAAIRHEKQYRKTPGTPVPYVTHVAAVGMMLADHGYPDDVVIAGILHDTVEDTGLTVGEIRAGFGDRVARIVDACTEQDKSLPWEERKRLYIEHLRDAPEEILAVSCCDKIHNLRSIARTAEQGHDPWASLKRGKAPQVERFEAMLAIFERSLPEDLLAAYRSALDAVRGL